MNKKPSTLYRASEWIVDHYRLFFIVFAVLLVFSAVASGWVKVENDVAAYLPADSEVRQGLDIMEQEFQTYGSAKILLRDTDADTAAAMAEQIRAVDGVDSCTYTMNDAGSALLSVSLSDLEGSDACAQTVQALRDLLDGSGAYIYSAEGYSVSDQINGEVRGLLVIVAIIPIIVYVERGQRRIPIQYAKRVVGRRVMGGQATYLPIKVNTAGVVPIIFASAILYLPAQLAVFFPNVGWVQAVANALSAGWINWVLSVLLIVAFAYFYSSMVFNPEETADQLRKQGGFIPGVRPGAATAAYIKNTIDHVTLPGALFMAVLAVVPSIIFWFTGNSLVQAFGGTSVLIMVGVAMDTLASLESQLKMNNYDGFFK